MTKLDHAPRGAKVIQVIEVVGCRGAGVDDDPFRLVTQWWTLDGVMIAEKDHLVIESLNTDGLKRF